MKNFIFYKMDLDFTSWVIEDYRYCGIIKLNGPFFKLETRMLMDPIKFESMKRVFYGIGNETDQKVVLEYANNLKEYLYIFEVFEKIPKTNPRLWQMNFLFSE